MRLLCRPRSNVVAKPRVKEYSELPDEAQFDITIRTLTPMATGRPYSSSRGGSRQQLQQQPWYANPESDYNIPYWDDISAITFDEAFLEDPMQTTRYPLPCCGALIAPHRHEPPPNHLVAKQATTTTHKPIVERIRDSDQSAVPMIPSIPDDMPEEHDTGMGWSTLTGYIGSQCGSVLCQPSAKPQESITTIEAPDRMMNAEFAIQQEMSLLDDTLEGEGIPTFDYSDDFLAPPSLDRRSSSNVNGHKKRRWKQNLKRVVSWRRRRTDVAVVAPIDEEREPSSEVEVRRRPSWAANFRSA